MGTFGSYSPTDAVLPWSGHHHIQEFWDNQSLVADGPPHNIFFVPNSSDGAATKHTRQHNSKPEWVDQTCWTEASLPSTEKVFNFSFDSTHNAWDLHQNADALVVGHSPVVPPYLAQAASNRAPLINSHQYQHRTTQEGSSEVPVEARTPSPMTPRSSVSSCSSQQSRTCNRISKPKKSPSGTRFRDKDSIWPNWPEVCLEQRFPTDPGYSSTNAESSDIRQLQWGSDTSFHTTTFVPPTNQTSHRVATDTWLGWVKSIAPSQQQTTTPDVSHDQQQQQYQRNFNESVNSQKCPTDSVKQQEDVLSTTNHTMTQHGDRNSAEKLRQRAKRRKEVHNISERKRREQLNRGFLDLCEIVPGLEISTHTRKEILFRAADWLEQFLHDNARLKAQLDRLIVTKSENS